jgi:hypothetical protein
MQYITDLRCNFSVVAEIRKQIFSFSIGKFSSEEEGKFLSKCCVVHVIFSDDRKSSDT